MNKESMNEKLSFINFNMVLDPSFAREFAREKKKSEKSTIVFQSKGTFNPGIILT